MAPSDDGGPSGDVDGDGLGSISHADDVDAPLDVALGEDAALAEEDAVPLGEEAVPDADSEPAAAVAEKKRFSNAPSVGRSSRPSSAGRVAAAKATGGLERHVLDATRLLSCGSDAADGPNPFAKENATFLRQQRRRGVGRSSPGGRRARPSSAAAGVGYDKRGSLLTRSRERRVLEALERLDRRDTQSTGVKHLQEVLLGLGSKKDFDWFVRTAFDEKKPLASPWGRRELLLLLPGVVRRCGLVAYEQALERNAGMVAEAQATALHAVMGLLQRRVFNFMMATLRGAGGMPELQDAVARALAEIVDGPLPESVCRDSGSMSADAFLEVCPLAFQALLDPLVLGTGWDCAIKKRCVMVLGGLLPTILGKSEELEEDERWHTLLSNFSRLLGQCLQVNNSLQDGILNCITQLAASPAAAEALASLPQLRPLAELCIAHLCETPSAVPSFVPNADAEAAGRAESPKRAGAGGGIVLTRELALVCCLCLKHIAEDVAPLLPPQDIATLRREVQPAVDTALARDNLNLQRLTRGNESLRQAIGHALRAWTNLRVRAGSKASFAASKGRREEADLGRAGAGPISHDRYFSSGAQLDDMARQLLEDAIDDVPREPTSRPRSASQPRSTEGRSRSPVSGAVARRRKPAAGPGAGRSKSPYQRPQSPEQGSGAQGAPARQKQAAVLKRRQSDLEEPSAQRQAAVLRRRQSEVEEPSAAPGSRAQLPPPRERQAAVLRRRQSDLEEEPSAILGEPSKDSLSADEDAGVPSTPPRRASRKATEKSKTQKERSPPPAAAAAEELTPEPLELVGAVPDEPDQKVSSSDQEVAVDAERSGDAELVPTLLPPEMAAQREQQRRPSEPAAKDEPRPASPASRSPRPAPSSEAVPPSNAAGKFRQAAGAAQAAARLIRNRRNAEAQRVDSGAVGSGPRAGPTGTPRETVDAQTGPCGVDVGTGVQFDAETQTASPPCDQCVQTGELASFVEAPVQAAEPPQDRRRQPEAAPEPILDKKRQTEANPRGTDDFPIRVQRPALRRHQTCPEKISPEHICVAAEQLSVPEGAIPALASVRRLLADDQLNEAFGQIFEFGNEQTLRAVLRQLEPRSIWPRLEEDEAHYLAGLLPKLICKDPFAEASVEACAWLEAMLAVLPPGSVLLDEEEDLVKLRGALFSISGLPGAVGTRAATVYYALFQQ
eukprot:TRINITY_DN10942_c0_g1_i2.p1 TRINITY_DN10942_c0_g1~~TRINITY_DN10942_c0_g1_i2.p1  ORF type:complete len:1207 (+),score=284.05 TRINITY_DN10942_c0_g1_i2:75-3623(+)